MKRFRRSFRGLLWIVLPALLFGCGGGKKDADDQKESRSLFKKALQKTENVTTFVVSSREAPLTITQDGKTEASDRYQAKAPGSVKIEKIFVEEGARVQPGDPLIQFNDETLALRLSVAQAEIREAEAGMNAFNGGPSPRETANGSDEGATGGENAAASANPSENLNEARAILYQAQLDRAKAETELYEKMQELQQLNSPIAGVVGHHEVGEGASASEDQLLLEIIKLDPVNFTFTIPTDQIAYVEKGSEIVVKLASFPGQEFPAEVSAVGSEANVGNGNIEVKLKIANPDLNLKGDLKGTVEIRTQERRKVVSIPESAVVRSERSAFVYKLSGGKAQRVAVDLGVTSGGQVEIEKGVADGDTIIASAEDGMDSLSDGAPVEVRSAKAEQ
ncbi:MAG TPA: efflux RND transporter periplasmic adaptor subunit [bacterium]|nr:efflux RND transporter periplasmic adaptor subunit [bacterium]